MTENDHQNSKSHHILSASSNLLGICFLIFSIIRVTKMHEKTFLDDLCLVALLLFMASSVLSYMSIRSSNKYELYEKYADTIFLGALSFLCLITIVTVLGFVY
jgi:hypothetical protein